MTHHGSIEVQFFFSSFFFSTWRDLEFDFLINTNFYVANDSHTNRRSATGQPAMPFAIALHADELQLLIILT